MISHFRQRCRAIVIGLAAVGLLAGGLAMPSTARAQPVTEKGSPEPYCTIDLTTKKTFCSQNEAEVRAAQRHPTIFYLFGQPNGLDTGKGTYLAVTRKGGECPGEPTRTRRMSDLSKIRGYLPKGQNWNNRISSTYSPYGCKVKLFAQRDWKGHRTGWLGRVDRLGTVPDPGDNWNNAATSFAVK